MSRFGSRALPVIAAFAALSCASANAYTWRAADYAPLPADGLAGAPVLILPLANLVGNPAVAGGADTGPAARAIADSVIVSTLNRRLSNVGWIPASEMRRKAEADPSLPHPDSMPMHQLSNRALMGVPRPLLDQMRALMATTQGHYLLVPVHLAYLPGFRLPARAQLTLMLVDTKVGANGWKSDVSGEGTDALSALTTAIRTLTAGPQ